MAFVVQLLERRRADGFEFANRQFGSRGNVHESRHASRVEKGVVHRSLTAHTKISEVPYKECGNGERWGG